MNSYRRIVLMEVLAEADALRTLLLECPEEVKNQFHDDWDEYADALAAKGRVARAKWKALCLTWCSAYVCGMKRAIQRLTVEAEVSR